MSDHNKLAAALYVMTNDYDPPTMEKCREIAQALWAAGWRKRPSREVLWRTILDGMDDWREMSTTRFAEGMTDAILALMDGLSEKGAEDVG